MVLLQKLNSWFIFIFNFFSLRKIIDVHEKQDVIRSDKEIIHQIVSIVNIKLRYLLLTKTMILFSEKEEKGMKIEGKEKRKKNGPYLSL